MLNDSTAWLELLPPDTLRTVLSLLSADDLSSVGTTSSAMRPAAMHCGRRTPCRCRGGSGVATRCRARQTAAGPASTPSTERPALVARSARPMLPPPRPASAHPHTRPSGRGGSVARLWPGRVASRTSLSRRAWPISSPPGHRRQHSPKAHALPWLSGSRGTTRSRSNPNPSPNPNPNLKPHPNPDPGQVTGSTAAIGARCWHRRCAPTPTAGSAGSSSAERGAWAAEVPTVALEPSPSPSLSPSPSP